MIYWRLEEYLTSKIHLNEYFLSIQISINWQARVLLHWRTIVIEWMVTPGHCRQKASKEATIRALIKGLRKTSENLFMLKLSYVDLNLLDRKEKNLPSKGNDRNISELWKRKSNCQTDQQLLKKLKYKKTWNFNIDMFRLTYKSSSFPGDGCSFKKLFNRSAVIVNNFLNLTKSHVIVLSFILFIEELIIDLQRNICVIYAR